MPSRNRAHQLETLSKTAFGNLIPKRWVIRDKVPDYGVDCEVEIFETSGAATGLFFNVQLKATDNCLENSALKVRIKASTCNYWRSLSEPVLVARYVAPEQAFYARWFHKFDMSTINRNINEQETFGLTFDASDILTSSNLPLLANEVVEIRKIRNGILPNPLVFDVVSEVAQIGSLTIARIVTELNQLVGFESEVRFKLSKTIGTTTIVLSEDTVSIQIANITGMSVGSDYSTLSSESFEEYGSTILVFLGASLCKAGFSKIGSELVVADHRKSIIFTNPEAALKIAKVLFETGDAKTIVILTKQMMNTPGAKTEVISSLLYFFFIYRSALNSLTNNLILEITDWVIRERKNLNDLKSAANVAYSFANFCRGFGIVRRSIKYYSRAARLDATYKDRDYFWQELAGALFEIKRYRWSSECYKRAEKLGSKNSIDSLLGDAHLHDGNFTEASSRLNIALSNNSIEHDFYAEYALKRKVAEILAAQHSLPLNRTNRDKARALLDAAINAEDPETNISKFEAVVNADPTFGLGWFNLATALNNRGLVSQARQSFLISAIFMRTDAEAWAMAFLVEGFSRPNDVTTALIAKAALQLVGEEFKATVVHKMEKSLSGPGAAPMTNEILRILESESNQSRKQQIMIRQGSRLKLAHLFKNLLSKISFYVRNLFN